MNKLSVNVLVSGELKKGCKLGWIIAHHRFIITSSSYWSKEDKVEMYSVTKMSLPILQLISFLFGYRNKKTNWEKKEVYYFYKK